MFSSKILPEKTWIWDLVYRKILTIVEKEARKVLQTLMLLLEVVTDKKMNLDEIKIIFENTIGKVPLTLSWRRPVSYRNKSIDLLCKSMDWFLYDNGPLHERVNSYNEL